MLLVVHILLAVCSLPLMAAAVLARWANRHKSYPLLVKLSLVSAAGLLLSGSALVAVYHASVTAVCLQGSLYLSGLGIAFISYKKLALVTE